MAKASKERSVVVPRSIFTSLGEAYIKWSEFTDELEDFLLISDAGFLKSMRTARKAHKENKVISIKELRKRISG